jgi:tetratricopeptide (TPR) repeat protein
MKKLVVTVLIGCLAVPALAQRHKIDINAETAEGQLLQQIGTEQDPDKKLTLLEEFASKHPAHEGLPWVYGQLQPAYLKAQQYDKVFPVVEKLLAFDPTDAEMAHGALKAAEAKKDPDLIMKWAVATSDAARKAVESKKPEDEDELELWKHKVDFAKQVETYTEYSLFSTAIQTADPSKKIELIDKLAERNPNSQYMPQLDDQKFLAYRQLNNADKAVEVAEKLIAKNPTNEDMLIFTADYAFQKKDYPKALDYSTKVVDLMKAKPAPQGIAAEDWEKKKTTLLGVGLFMQGMINSSQAKYGPADQVLREALPYLESNEQMKAAALFNLGLANYKLGDNAKSPNTQRILDALKFNQMCAAIKSPFQGQAQKNITVIRTQYRIR